MQNYVLASGSTGNAYIVTDGVTTLLLECGLPIRDLMRRVRAVGFSLADMHACLITHEHGDHSLAASDLLHLGIPVYCTSGTAMALGLVGSDPVKHMHQVQISTITVLPFAVDHDAAEPVGYLLYSSRTKERLLFATDASRIPYVFPGVHHWLVECNYLPEALGDTNAALAERVMRSHMSLPTLLAFLEQQDLTCTKDIRLIHISRSHGDPAAMTAAVARLTGKQVSAWELKGATL